MANPNPLGAALELMLGAGAAVLTAWQQAIVAAVFELCLVGVMVIYELPGQRGPPVAQEICRERRRIGAGKERDHWRCSMRRRRGIADAP